MLYMVIEKYKTAGAIEIYRRAKLQGRMMPEGLEYISSWVDNAFSRCYQHMKTENVKLFDRWILQWRDLVEFEVAPVQTSAEAKDKIAPRL